MDDEDLDLLLALADEAEEDEPALANPNSRTSLRPSAKAGQSQASHPPAQPRAAAPVALLRSQSLPRAAPSVAAQAPAQPTSRQPVRQVADGYTDSISGFRVSKPVIGSLVLKDRLTDDCVYISLKDISPSRDLAGRWATIAVLVSKVQATGRDGSPYSRWTLSDLAGKQVTLFLWRKAASEHYKELEGSLMLLWSPQVRRDEGGSGSGGAGYSLHIDKPEMLQRPGMSADFGLCRGTRKDGQRCTIPINKSTCEYCPYHAQAALRALSSNRSDMAGANLLQRQLLPQARAAQKHLAATTGKPLSGINSLIARPPPPKLLPGGATARLGAGVSRAAGAGSSFAAAAATGTGAYGVSGDYEEGGGGGGSGAAPGSVGGKRSYGAQLLANLQERQAGAEDGGGPAAKRRRSSADAGDDKSGTSVSAAKARAIAAARATGQLGKQSGGTAAAQRVPPAAVPGGVGAVRRPPSLSGPRFSMPPPLPAELASLLTPPVTNGGRKASGTVAGGSLRQNSASGDSGRGQVSGCGLGDAQPPNAGASRVESANVGACDGEEDDLIVELEAEDDIPPSTAAEPEREEPGPHSEANPGKGGFSGALRSRPGVGYGAGGTEELVNGDDGPRVAPPDEHRQRQHHAEGNTCDGATGPSGTGGAAAGRGGEQAQDGDGCGLDELLELFPELQDADEPVQAQQQDSNQHQPGEAAAVGRMQLSQSQMQSPSTMRAVGQAGEANPARDACVAAAAGSGSCGGGIRAGTGMPAAVATGLLPRVAGLGVAPSALAAAARKQQAAAAKVQAEKLKLLGMKPPPAAALSAPSKPLSAASMLGGQAQAAKVAAAAALAAAKGLPMPRSGARTAASQAAAGGTVSNAPAPTSALAAAFGSLVQKLPEAEGASRYSELSEEAADEAMLSMLEGLEARDALVKQLDSITHLKVTAWHCVECNRLSEFMDKQCRAEGHTLSKATTLKRFWTCDHCNARITTLGVRFPASRCSRCNNPSLEFTACTMYRGPRELKPAGMASTSGLASKETLFATIEQHPEIGRRTFR